MKTSHIITLNIFITLLLLGGFYYAINTYGTQFLTGAWDKNGVTKVINQKVIQENVNEYRRLSDLESDLTKAIETASSSVMHIAKSDNLTLGSGGYVTRMQADGTAVVATSDGYLITNKHVVSDLKETYSAVSTEGKHFAVDKIWLDPVLDFAVIKLVHDTGSAVNDLSAAAFVSTESKLSLGQFATALGSSQTSPELIQKNGTISQKNIAFTVLTGDSSINLPYFSIDTTVHAGFSGGPTIDLVGNVIGITTASQQGGQQGALILPVTKEFIQETLSNIVQYGKISRPTFGATLTPLNTYRAETMGLKKFNGRYVQKVASGSNAGRAGLLTQDIITQVNGKEIPSAAPFAPYRLSYGSGDTIEITVQRENNTKKLSLTVQ